jgi:crossover junction endodeoxyribonuclease RuvC
VKILGIDPGSRVTGYGVVSSAKGSSYVKVAEGEIKVNTRSELPVRLKEIYTGLKAVIEEHRPDAVSIESVFYGKNVKSAIVMSHARGVALLSAAEHSISVYEYSPTLVKQSVVGNGHATKEQVQHMVKLLLKSKEIIGPDSADALAIAICHINHQGPLSRVAAQ